MRHILQQTYPGTGEVLDKILKPALGDYETHQQDILSSYPDMINVVQSAHISSIRQVASFDLDKQLDVFDITLSRNARIHYSRVNIQRAVRSIMDVYSGALMLFHYEDNQGEWRISFAEKANSLSNTTPAKRYTYLLGENHSSRTLDIRLKQLQSKAEKSLEAIRDAFSVEKLSDEFFEKYKSIYADFVEYISGKRFVKNGGKWIEKVMGTPNSQFETVFKNNDKLVRDYVKKLLGRVVFLYFIQKKGWLGVSVESKDWSGGDVNFLYTLFKKATPEQQSNFLETVLEPLFFNCLNELRPGDVFDTGVKAVGCEGKVRIPYLNGGLFERDDIDELSVSFPKEKFEKLFVFFSQYNFTIDENDPDDAEIGVDPEMLGKIFENLLEDNKDKGAFYTPKEIVQYMCRETLIAYLNEKMPEQEASIRQLVQEHKVGENWDEAIKENTLQLLKDVKVCDPAIGSGAFPMGMLNELYKCRLALGETKSAEIKKHIIQNNIYGVDIESGAVDIARLRFWLALVVDDDGPQPLPNLDYKIMQGNSLLESFKGIDLSSIFKKLSKNDQVRIIFDDESVAIELLQKNLTDYFYETDHVAKCELRKKIDNAVKLLIRAKTQQNKEILEELDSIDCSANSHFFLWHTYFADVFNGASDCNTGFDIVIGNPPYVRQEKLTNEYKNLLCSTYPNIGNGIADLYVYFFGLGLKLLNPQGVLVLITLNKYLKTKYGKELRNTLATGVTVDLIIDFFELPVFNASTDASITKIFKEKKAISTRYFPIKTLDNLDLEKTTKGDFQITIKDEDEWKFIDYRDKTILEKIHTNTQSLKEFTNDKIFYGVKTGANEVFVLKNEVAQQLLNSESAPLVKRYAKPTSIKKWQIEGDENYFLATGYDIDLIKYPTALNYVNNFKNKLQTRCDKGVNYWNLRACAYYDEFEKH